MYNRGDPANPRMVKLNENGYQLLNFPLRSTRPSLLLLVTVFLALSYSTASAVEWTKRFSVTTGVDYDSNPVLSIDDKEPVWIYSLTPQVQLEAADVANRWFLDAALVMNKYSNERELTDREDPKFTVGWDRTYESGMFGIVANYFETTSRIDELSRTGEFTDRNGTQRTKSIAAKWDHAINSRLGILTETSYGDNKFNDTSGLGSYDISDVRSKLSYQMTEKLVTYGQVGYSYLRPDHIYDDSRLTRTILGADYQLSETLELGLYGGLYNLSGQQSDNGWEAGAHAKYTPTTRTTYEAGLYRDVADSGIGGFLESDTLQLKWSSDLSERSRTGAEYFLRKTKKDTDIDAVKVDYQSLAAYYERNLSSHWLARLSFTHNILELDDKSYSNVVGVSLTYDTFSF